jgi:hypothetical protein
MRMTVASCDLVSNSPCEGFDAAFDCLTLA